MTHVTCRLTAKNRDQLRNPTLGNRVWATVLSVRFRLRDVNGALSSVGTSRLICVARSVDGISPTRRQWTPTMVGGPTPRMTAGCRCMESARARPGRTVLPATHSRRRRTKMSAGERVSFAAGRRFHGPARNASVECRRTGQRRNERKIQLESACTLFYKKLGFRRGTRATVSAS